MNSDSAQASIPLFRIQSFRLLFTTRVAANTANQMQTLAIGWQVYAVTGSALDLGLIGLVQFLPPLFLTLVAGPTVDRHNRRLILRYCYTVQLIVSASLLLLATLANPPVIAILLLLLLNGVSRTFEGPALQSLLPQTVPREALMRAVSAHASAGKMSQLLGPPISGTLLLFGGGFVYGTCMALVATAAIANYRLPPTPRGTERPKITWDTVLAGITFIWSRPLILGTMTLDLMASLFGGVTALLPIFAKDILQIDSWGFGLLRCAPAVGALLLAALLSRLPVTRRAGATMFCALAVYGCAIIAFGLSTSFPLSIALLMTIGASDMLGTIIRYTIIQTSAPDDMRGRIFAVNTLFVNTAGHLGTFESGVTAAWFGAVGSAVLGGGAVLVILCLWLWRFPSLRELDRPDEVTAHRYNRTPDAASP